MRKYSNVNANSLLYTASTAIDELNNYNLTDVKNNKAIKSSATQVISDSLYDIVYSANKKGSIRTLKNKLESLVTASEYIKKYQQTEKEINSLQKKLYKKETSYERSTDSNGNPISKEVIEWVIDKIVQAQIKTLENNIISYENKIDFYLG